MAIMKRRPIRRPGFNVGRAFNSALNTAVTASKLYNNIYTATKQKSSSTTGVTTQHDSRTVYRKRRMPKRKKRPWKKFVRKVRAVINRSVASETIMFNGSQVNTNATGNNNGSFQSWNICMLYGNNGNPGNPGGNGTLGNNDLRKVVNILTGSIGSTTATNSKIAFETAVMDITLSYSGTYGGPLELDLYDVVFRKEPPDSTIANTLSNALLGTTTLPTGSALTLDSRGVTPFDIPLFLSQSGCTILKKVKYFMAPGNAITYQIRDPRNRYLTKHEITDYGIGSTDNASNFGTWAKRGWTRGILYVFKPVATSFTDGSIQINAGATRKYLCKVLSDNQIQDSYQIAN